MAIEYGELLTTIGRVVRTLRTEVPMVSREDAILSKLLWIKKGSGRSRDDVTAMLKRNEPLDVEYVERQAEALGLGELWRELRLKAGK